MTHRRAKADAARAIFVALLVASVGSCAPFGDIIARNAAQLLKDPVRVENKIEEPRRDDARLAVLWVGHATLLIQIDDRMILTDPVFTHTVAMISPRMVEPGLDIDNVPNIDACLISHLHFDHLSLETLDDLEPKIDHLFAPRGGLVYIPDFDFPTDELATWESVEYRGMRITAVPVKHQGSRYGIDTGWLNEGYAGWVIEHNGITVYFGGDTAFDEAAFRQTRARFGPIDVALLPIAPITPDAFMRKTHISADEAIQTFRLLGAKRMIPMHYDTFPHGLDPVGTPLERLREAMATHSVANEEVIVLPHGAQAVLIPKAAE
jgi:N-acyl-phosphatidylethanolamine-hydrolysing phospholipase D